MTDRTPTAVRRPVLLSHLVGSILAAVVEADGQAGLATAEFVREVGFVSDRGRDGHDQSSDYGRMRMVRFQYRQPDSMGNSREVTVEAPLLSLIPIPLLSVQEADLAFGVQILDLEPSPDPEDPLPRIKAVISDSSRDVDLKLKMQSSDVPAGMGQLFHLLGNSLHTLPGNHDEGG